MTITTIQKDLFTMPQSYWLCHCVSADFTLGGGIARTFNSVYDMRSKLYRDYPNYQYRGGDALPVSNVFNLVTKDRVRDWPTYESMREALEMMREYMDFMGVTKIAMPTLGCGLDRLQWDKVKSIIEDVFADTDVDIVVCVL